MTPEKIDKLPMFWTDDPQVQLTEYYQNRRLFRPMRHVIHRLVAYLEKRYPHYHKTLRIK